MKSANRVVFNTGIVYAKLFLSIVIGFFVVRLVLDALGETDYGIFQLVAGVIGMLSFLKTTLSHASMRFIAHSLGAGDSELLKKTFNTSLFIHLIAGVVIFFVMVAGGYLMFKYLLDIPAGRLSEAKFVFYCMVVSTFAAVVSVPYISVMKSHEDFLALNLIELFGTLTHFGIAIYLSFASGNLLVTYGVCVLIMRVMLAVLKRSYSRRKYEECRSPLLRNVDRSVIGPMFSFSGWTFLGSTTTTLWVQSRSVLLNMFFGVSLNAADGITRTLTNKLNGVVVSMTEAIYPQIIKNEGKGEREKMLMLTAVSAKFSVFLFALFSIPVFIEMPYLLEVWLKDVPDYVIIFSRLLLLHMLISKFTFSITRALKAIGRIREICIAESAVFLLSIPSAFMLFRFGMPPQTIFFVGIVFTFGKGIIRLCYGKVIAGIRVKDYLRDVVIKAAFPLVFSVLISLLPVLLINEGFSRLLSTTTLSFFATLTLIRYLGLTQIEYDRLKGVITDALLQIKNKI